MIETSIFYAIRCDRCHTMYETSCDSNFFNDEQEVIEYAIEDEWVEKDGRHYCPSCYEYLDEDNFKIKPKYPKEVFKVENLLKQYVSNGGASIDENEDNFEISCYISSKETPNISIINMIGFIIGEFSWDYRLEDLKNARNAKFFVKIYKK